MPAPTPCSPAKSVASYQDVPNARAFQDGHRRVLEKRKSKRNLHHKLLLSSKFQTSVLYNFWHRHGFTAKKDDKIGIPCIEENITKTFHIPPLSPPPPIDGHTKEARGQTAPLWQQSALSYETPGFLFYCSCLARLRKRGGGSRSLPNITCGLQEKKMPQEKPPGRITNGQIRRALERPRREGTPNNIPSCLS